MPRYEYQTSYFHKRSKARRVRAVALTFAVIVLLFSVWISVDWLRERLNKNSKQSQETSVTVQSQAVTSFRSEYFEFQANTNWREIYEERRPNRFVYRSFDGPLVEDVFIIEINTQAQRSLAEQTSTRVLPVTIKADSTIAADGLVSDHCKKVYPESSTALPKIIKMNQVDFLCNPNSTQYHVLIGVVGGTTELKMTRDSGQATSYFMEYKSFRTNPDSNDLLHILSTFKAK